MFLGGIISFDGDTVFFFILFCFCFCFPSALPDTNVYQPFPGHIMISRAVCGNFYLEVQLNESSKVVSG